MDPMPPLERRELTPAERSAVVDRVSELLDLTHHSRPIEGFPANAGIESDEHSRRILDRLGLVKDRGTKSPAEPYQEVIPDRVRADLHSNLTRHGLKYCRETDPLCANCPLISFCAPGRDGTLARPKSRQQTPKPSSAKHDRPRAKPVAVELFAGGGGLGEGFTRAGFDIAVAVEWDRCAAQTYRVNHPGTVVVEADATTVTAAHIKMLAPRAAKAAAIIAGPPCQGYSIAGKRQAADGKNSLYQAVVKLAAELRPRFVAIENVPGLRHVGGQSFEATINDALGEAGFNSAAYLLRACDYGVPQLRRRLLFLAQRSDLGPAPAAPAVSHCAGKHCLHKCGDVPGLNCKLTPTPTVLESLKGLPAFKKGTIAERVFRPDSIDVPLLLNASTMNHSDKVVRKIEGITPGSGPISYRRLHSDIARTIVAGHRALPVHPTLNRTLSVREAARIQGFGDLHVFSGKRSRQPLQVANAVPPALGCAVALALLAARKRARPAPAARANRSSAVGQPERAGRRTRQPV
jgi:DNA (cytosine-5)-methyltransferase 1